jgi:uncharacterized protein GlcG (DUF336 family)
MDVQNIVMATAQATNVETMVIAVADRQGNVLAVFHKPLAPANAIGNYGAMVSADDLAVSLARTAAFFSNDQAPLSSRTVRFISGIHFPPGVMNAPTADLYGIENTNRGCTLATNYLPGQALPPAQALLGGPGLGIATGKADLMDSSPFAVNPGGVPIFKNGFAIGGVGVVAGTAMTPLMDVAEYAAFVGATSNGFGPTPAPPGVVFIGGIALPFVNNTTAPPGISPDPSFMGTFPVIASVTPNPQASPGPPPEGDLITPVAGPMGGLTAAEVTQILNNAQATANMIRGVIRLPIGARARMVIAVADLDGTLIGFRRMPDATIFSADVAASKARNMIYFNSSARQAADLTMVPLTTSVTNRTISFGAQPFYPPGIDGTAVGPFFNLFTMDTANPCSQGFQAPGPNQSGIVFFPGSVGLYRNGILIGGLGVSGDGVDQDDYVTNGGWAGFEAPTAIRADQIFVNNVRLPFLKFPRNPTN